MGSEIDEDLDISLIDDDIDLGAVDLLIGTSDVDFDNAVSKGLLSDSISEGGSDEDSSDDDLSDDCDDDDIEEFFQQLQREPLSDVCLFFIYMNTDNSIEKIEKDMEPIDDSIISKERLLQIVQTKRNCGGKKYRLNDILSFQLPFEKDYLDSFIHSEENLNYLVPVPIFNEIAFQPALYIFHDMIALYFFFSESYKPLKSVLLHPGDRRVTKKVRIAVDDPSSSSSSSTSYSDHKRKSLKRFMRRGNVTRKMAMAAVSEPVL